jgi:hypothetical protein
VSKVLAMTNATPSMPQTRTRSDAEDANDLATPKGPPTAKPMDARILKGLSCMPDFYLNALANTSAKGRLVHQQCIPKLLVAERAVCGASMPRVEQLSLNSMIVVSLTLKRPEAG